MSQSIEFEIDLSSRNAHLFNVVMHIPDHKEPSIKLTLPAWIPGSYMIRDFAKNIINLTAHQQETALTVTPLDKQSWEITTNGKASTVQYQVYALDTSIRTAYLNAERAFFNGTSLFLCAESFRESAQHVTFSKNDVPNDWRIATGLPRETKTQRYEFGGYIAQDYAQLIDCPVEIGQFDAFEFSVNNIDHMLILTGKHYADIPRVLNDLQKLCEHHIALFNDAPFEEYWFLTNILPNSFGGLEHKNSTALLCSNFDFPSQHSPNELSKGYRTFLSLFSHEYFHAWNVCRLKPKAFVTPDLSQEAYTQQLWAYEGITSYYDDFSLCRTGIISFKEYLALVATTYTLVSRGAGENKLAVAESSYYTWTKFYKQGEDAINNIVSYYGKGALIAIWLDLSIRKSAEQTQSLDDVMRLLWQRHGKSETGTSDADLVNAIAEVGGAELASSLENHLIAREPFTLKGILAEFGIEEQTDAGQLFNLREKAKTPPKGYIGANLVEHKLGLSIHSVFENSSAEVAGWQAGDVLVAMDNMQATKSNIEQIIAQYPLNQPLTCHLFRDQQLLTTKIVLSEAPSTIKSLQVIDTAKATKWWPTAAHKNTDDLLTN